MRLARIARMKNIDNPFHPNFYNTNILNNDKA